LTTKGERRERAWAGGGGEDNNKKTRPRQPPPFPPPPPPPPSLVAKKNARRYDDCLTYSLVSSKKALIQAGIEIGSDAFNKLDRTRCGILVGSGMGGLTVFQDGVKNLIEKGVKKISPFFIPYAITNMGGALVGIETGFMGPNYSISTACATANYAFVSAANHIRAGDADLMVVGGSEAPIIPVGLGGFVACRALSTRTDDPVHASRPWDKGRDGFVMGEGAGVLVMESLEHAQKRGAPIIAEYLGGAVTCDAYHMTDPRADGLGVSTCIELALKNAQIERDQVGRGGEGEGVGWGVESIPGTCLMFLTKRPPALPLPFPPPPLFRSTTSTRTPPPPWWATSPRSRPSRRCSPR
jgi:3-oxoacyl-(acyl-carrier-protein) synthase